MGLLKDNDSTLLEALLNHYSQTKSQEIKRFELLTLSGSEGKEMAPANFQRSLERLENLHIIQRIKVGKGTVITFRVEMVKTTLEKKAQTSNFQNLTEEIEPEAWELLIESTMNKIIEQVTSTWNTPENSALRYGDIVTKNAISGLVGLIMSNSLELYILQNSWNLRKAERKEAIEDLVKAVGKFTKGNPDEPFTITIQFHGFQQTFDKMAEYYQPIIHKIAPYLLIFSERVLNHRFSEKDKFFLSRGRIDKLSSPARKCFDIFWSRMRTFIPKSAYKIG